jgi:hypothetical protein
MYFIYGMPKGATQFSEVCRKFGISEMLSMIIVIIIIIIIYLIT